MTGKVETGFIDVPGGQLYYEIVGAGPALVLIHAAIADARMWDEQVAAFAEQYRVIRFDVRGFGQSKSGDVSFSYQQDLRDLFAALGIEKAHLMGVSRGGMIITDFALEYPGMVRSLIPVCAGLGGFEEKPSPQELARYQEIGAADERHDYERLVELGLQVWVDGFHRTPDQVDPAVREKVRVMLVDNFKRHSTEHLEPQPLLPPAAGRLADIHVPTLVIVGGGDTTSILAACDRLARGIPGAQKAVIDNTAHMPNMEKPAEFNRLALDFLRGVA